MASSTATKFCRLFADPHGESRIEDMAVPMTPRDFAPPAEPFRVSEPQTAHHFVIIDLPVGWGGEEPHPTPGRHMLFMLSGQFRMTPSVGEPRTFNAGDGVLMEDTFGKGHRTEVTSAVPVSAVMIRLT